jgi:tetratricopeptide (TPR) repeat protein
MSVAGKVFIPVLHQDPSEVAVPPFMARYQWVGFAGRHESAAYAELDDAVLLGQSRRREDAGAGLERLGPPFDLGALQPTDHFVGREDDLRWVLDHLQPSPGGAGLASIAATNGFAGIGKSTLAWRAIQQLFIANRFPDGIAVVKCNDLADPVVVLRQVLRRFDPLDREPEERDVDALGRKAAALFASRRALVVLDNVEPQLPIAQVVAALRTAGAALLLTSRQELPVAAVPPEASKKLELLPPAQALELFAEYYGRHAAPDLTPPEQTAAARIVAALGYHTLAVKLAATYARKKQRDLANLAREYESDPRLAQGLKDGDEAVLVLLDSSYAALPDAGQRLLAALAAFPTADVGRNAILAVAQALQIPAARDGLDAIEDLRLAEPAVEETLTSEDADRERVRLHPLVRAYARTLFDAWEADPRNAARAAAATWYARYANEVPATDIEPDEANITGAFALASALGDDRLVAAIANGMKTFWRDRSRTDARQAYLPVGLAAAEQVVQADGATSGDHLRLANLQYSYAELAQHLGDLDAATDYAARSLAGYRAAGNRRGEGVALSLLGDLERQRGELDAAQPRYEQYLAIMREVKDQAGIGVALYKLGQIAELKHEFADAEGYFRQGLAVARAVNDAANLAIGARLFGAFLITQRDKRDEGCALLQEAIRLYSRMGLQDQAEQARATAQRLGCGS